MTPIRLWLMLMAKRLLWLSLACVLGFGGYRAWQADVLTGTNLVAKAKSLFVKQESVAERSAAERSIGHGRRSGESYKPASGALEGDRDLGQGHVVPTSTGQSPAGQAGTEQARTGQIAASVEAVVETSPQAAKPPPLPIKLDRESTCLARAIYYEAAHDPLEARIAIAHVAMVRLAQTTPKSSMCGVVFNGKNTPLGCLFVATCRNAGAVEPSGEAWRQAQQIATDLTAGRLNALTASRQPALAEATHFHAVGEKPGWLPNVNKLTQVGRFVFLGRPAAVAAAAPAPLVPDVVPNRVAPPTVAVTAKAEASQEDQPSVMAMRKPLARSQATAADAPAKAKAQRASADWMGAGQ